MSSSAALERCRRLTALCRRCHETLRLGNCEDCPLTEERRRARKGWNWADRSDDRPAGPDSAPPR